MNIRNLTLFGILTVLAAVSHSYCMMNIVNKTIQRVGTLVGMGLATYPIIKKSSISLYTKYKNQELFSYYDSVDMSIEHQTFYREKIILNKNVKLKTTKQDESGTVGNIITLQEYVTLNNQKMSLSEAIETNNEHFLSLFKAIAEHEYLHYKKNHNYISEYVGIITPLTTTLLSVFVFKKLLPLPASNNLAEHVTRAIAKMGAGNAGFTINEKMTLATRCYTQRQQEYQADAAVSPENREALAQYLTEKLNAEVNSWINFNLRMKPTMNKEKQAELKLKYMAEYGTDLWSTHPSPLKRASALRRMQHKKV